MLQLSFGWIKRDNSKFTVHLAPHLDIDCKKIDIVTGFCVERRRNFKIKVHYVGVPWRADRTKWKRGRERKEEKKNIANFAGRFVNLFHHFVKFSASAQQNDAFTRIWTWLYFKLTLSLLQNGGDIPLFLKRTFIPSFKYHVLSKHIGSFV